MMKLRRKTTGDLPIFADLAIELNGVHAVVDVEEPDWLSRHRGALERADRVGLQLRGAKSPCVWLAVNGSAPEYLSRVVGWIDETEHDQTRVAGLVSGGVAVWLHRDGLVEVGPEPTFRKV